MSCSEPWPFAGPASQWRSFLILPKSSRLWWWESSLKALQDCLAGDPDSLALAASGAAWGEAVWAFKYWTEVVSICLHTLGTLQMTLGDNYMEQEYYVAVVMENFEGT